MPKNPHQRLRSLRPSSLDTRQILAHVIEAREKYSNYLRAVATGQRQPDLAEKTLLKLKCDETISAWRAAHEAWRITPSAHEIKTRDN